MENKKVQEIECKEDLELLIVGDSVNVKLQNFEGIANFRGKNECGLIFSNKNEKRYQRYYVNEQDIGVKNNTIIEIKDGYGRLINL